MTLREMMLNDVKKATEKIMKHKSRLVALQAPRLIIENCEKVLKKNEAALANNLNGYKFKGYTKYSHVLDEDITNIENVKYTPYFGKGGKKTAAYRISTASGKYYYVPAHCMVTADDGEISWRISA